MKIVVALDYQQFAYYCKHELNLNPHSLDVLCISTNAPNASYKLRGRRVKQEDIHLVGPWGDGRYVEEVLADLEQAVVRS